MFSRVVDPSLTAHPRQEVFRNEQVKRFGSLAPDADIWHRHGASYQSLFRIIGMGDLIWTRLAENFRRLDACRPVLVSVQKHVESIESFMIQYVLPGEDEEHIDVEGREPKPL